MKKQNPAYKSKAATLACLAVFFALAAAGCGGGDDAPAPAPAPTPAPAPAPAPAPPPLPTIAPAVDLDANQQVGVTFWSDGDTATGGLGQAIQNILCVPNLSGLFHIHSHLSIIVNGEARAIPANVGIMETATTDCHYYVHTHDRSGKIHIEPPVATTFTLGQLFAIWGQPLGPTDVGGNPGLPVVIYLVDGTTASRYQGDFAAIELKSRRGIVIQMGTTIAEIPRYTWFGP